MTGTHLKHLVQLKMPHDWSMTTLAEKLKLKPNALENRFGRDSVKMDFVIQICNVLGMSLTEFLPSEVLPESDIVNESGESYSNKLDLIHDDVKKILEHLKIK